MPSRPADRPLTYTERARRAQLIGVTIELVARYGYAGTSLSRIAEAAGISKAAVLYHFPSKDKVVQAAYADVIDALTRHVGGAVEAESGAGAVRAYVRALVGHLVAHPDHTRMVIEAIGGDTGVSDTTQAPSRREAVAGLIEAAVAAGDYRAGTDATAVAVIINGAVDGIVAERLADPSFDASGAADRLVELLDGALTV